MSSRRTAERSRRLGSRRKTSSAQCRRLAARCKLVDEPNYCTLPEVPRIVNHTLPLNVIDLNGGSLGPSGERPYIYVYNQPSAGARYTIAVDMSLMNRPDGFGYFVNGSNMSIYFPDDRDHTGTIDPDGRTTRWSNNTVWTKQ